MKFTILRSSLNRINVVANRLSMGNVLVLKVIMISALLVVFARSIAPFEIGKDQALQLEAAQRLVMGQGLTSTYFASPPNDISQPPVAETLTWWPPGFSLIVAAMLFTGLPLMVVLKIIYVCVTLIGWLGWAVIASHFFAEPFTYRGKSYRLNLFLIALLPIFFTPFWNGTDIILWAGTPPFILFLFKRGDSKSSLKYVALSGVLLGLLFAFRYASIFLGIAAVLILFQLNYPSIKSFLKRLIVFVVASGITILPTVLYIKWLSHNGSVVPNVVSEVNPNLNFLVTATLFTSRAVSNLIFGFQEMEWLILALRSRALIMIAGAICLLTVLALPLFVARKSHTPLQKNLALSLSFIPWSLIVFLFFIVIASKRVFFGEERYYVPVSLCGMFIFYQMFVSQKGTRFIKVLASLVILPLLGYICLFLPIQALRPNRTPRVVRLTLGYSPAKNSVQSSTSYSVTYPSFELYSIKENSRRKLIELKRDNPQAIFFVDNYGYYVYDNFRAGPIPGIDLRRFPSFRSTFWSTAYTSKTVRVFFVIDPLAEKRIPTSHPEVIFYDPDEKTKIYVSEIQANTWFSNVSETKGSVNSGLQPIDGSTEKSGL